MSPDQNLQQKRNNRVKWALFGFAVGMVGVSFAGLDL